ncbi:MAG: hypothetical protein LBW85_01385 [Deltaproteobacteria bacterium]|nr:hypothetical protein [Deltaproteobacteria bacterium]
MKAAGGPSSFVDGMFERARAGTVPDGYPGWTSVADPHGYTLAHAAALEGLLPRDYRDWDRADNSGRTVLFCQAVGMALRGELARSNEAWFLKDGNGMTVWEEYERMRVMR